MTVRFTLAALRQIEQCLAYVEARSPQGAKSIRDRLDTAIGLVAKHPLAGQETSRRGTRRVVLGPYPYVLFYRIVADGVVVTRFRHAARRPLSGERPA